MAFFSKAKKYYLLASILLFGMSGFGVSWLYFHNFHEVIPGIIFRAPQPSDSDLKHWIKTYHIRSILNLRGENHGETWYDQEMLVSQQFKIIHRDIPLQSKTLPSKTIIVQLAHDIETLPKPLLIHCESGVDRSGFASALALLLFTPTTLDDMNKQVSWRYFVFSSHSIGRQFMNSYDLFLKQHHLPVSRNSFQQWIEN